MHNFFISARQLTLNTDGSGGSIRNVGSYSRQSYCKVAHMEVSISRKERSICQGTVEDELSLVVTIGGVVNGDVDSWTVRYDHTARVDPRKATEVGD